MSDIAELGFEANTGPLTSATEALDKLSAQAKTTEISVAGLNKEVETNSVAKMGAFQRIIAGVGTSFNAVRGSLGNAANSFTSFFKLGDDGKERLHKMSEGVDELGGKFKEGLVDGLKNAGAAFIAFFAIEALKDKLEETSEALDKVSKAARNVGSTVPQMQALATAGQLAGVGADAIATATLRMNRVLGTAIATGKGADGVFKELGITAAQLAALPIDKRFELIADRLKTLGATSEDTTAVLAKLGDRGGMLVGLMGEGGDKIREAAKDVKDFNLAVTSLQGKQIEEMNDNFMRLGYSIQGAFNQFIAKIAPVVGPLIGDLAHGIAFLVQNISAIVPYLETIAPAMIIIFGPAAVAAIWTFANAILGGAVVAFYAMSKAIISNPIGLLITALVTVITAVWVFRDAIKQAVGIDVPSVVTLVANTIIRSFLDALEQVKFGWNEFPHLFGGIIAGVANAMADGLNGLIQMVSDAVNKIIDIVPPWMRGGDTSGHIDLSGFKIGHMDNPLGDVSAGDQQALSDKLAAINQTDYVKGLTDAFNKLTGASDTSKLSLDASGKAGTGMGSAFADAADGGVDKMAKKLAELTAKVRQFFLDTFGSAMKTFVNDLMAGKSALDSLTDALGDLGSKLMDKTMDLAIDTLFNGLSGSIASGGGGTIGNAILSLINMSSKSAMGSVANDNGPIRFASGGSFTNSIVSSPTLFKYAQGGKLGEMGEAGPEAIMPLKRGPNGSLGVQMLGGGSMPVIQPAAVAINVQVINNASDQTSVTTSKSQDGSLTVIIDRIVAQNLNNSGSQTAKAMKGAYGVQRATVAR